MIKIGGVEPSAIMVGDAAVSAVYHGADLVWEDNPELFDASSPYNINASVSYNSSAVQITFPTTFGGNRYTYFFEVKPNTTYRFSCKTAGDRLYISYYNSVYTSEALLNAPTGSIKSDYRLVNLLDGVYTYTFTTNNVTKMVGIYYSLNTLPTGISIKEVK